MKLSLLLLLMLVALAVTQDDDAAGDGEGEDSTANEDGEKEEECEEAWEYLDFLKANVKGKIETIMRDTLFQPQALLETTVADTMAKVLEIRDDILDRTKAIRTEDGEITICPEQGIKQEEFLTNLRMDVMAVLLRLIEPDAATTDSLKEVGRQLLSIRTTVNGKITQLIMLRENTVVTDSGEDCDCGILSTILKGLDEIIGVDKKEDEEETDGEDAVDEEGGQGESQSEGGEDGPVGQLTMILMTVDNRIGVLYNEILGQLDENQRSKSSEELFNLKEISKSINEVLTKLVGEDNESKIARILSRDVVRVRNEVDRLLQQCRRTCITECEACGADKIDEVLDKLGDYNVSLLTLDEEDAKDTIRSDLIAYLTQTNEEMTKLLTEKIESGNTTLNQCSKETLEVINSIKGPLWMLVNITIFGEAETLDNMIYAFQTALLEMRSKYCDSKTTIPEGPEDDNQCDLDEIETAGTWIVEIDNIISNNLFKADDEGEARTNAMLGFVELKSAMEERVRQLFQENLVCKEEVDKIKNGYSGHVNKCLAEMMSPRYRFETKSRAERVQCIKQLRVQIELRRGDLLLKEVERRIQEVTVATPGTASSDVEDGEDTA